MMQPSSGRPLFGRASWVRLEHHALPTRFPHADAWPSLRRPRRDHRRHGTPWRLPRRGAADRYSVPFFRIWSVGGGDMLALLSRPLLASRLLGHAIGIAFANLFPLDVGGLDER